MPSRVTIQCNGPCLVIWPKIFGSMLWTLSSADEPVSNGYSGSIEDVMQAARDAAEGAKIPWACISIVRIEQEGRDMGPPKGILERIRQIGERVPDDVWESIPSDASKNLDKYLYSNKGKKDV